MWGYGPNMMGYGQWGGGGWLMPFGGLFWILVLIVVIVLIVRLVREPRWLHPPGEHRSPGLDVLEERYARGEIGRDEYLQKKRDIVGRG